jgi:hypothetical protein
MHYLFLSIILCFTSSLLYAQDQKSTSQQKIAVFDIINESNFHSEEMTTFRQFMIDDFKQYLDQNIYQIIDQKDVTTALLSHPQTSCFQNCEIQIGKKLGIKWIVKTTFQELPSTYRLSIKVYDTEHGLIVLGQIIEETEILELEKSLRKEIESLSKDLAKGIVNQVNLEELKQIAKNRALGLGLSIGFGGGIEYAYFNSLQLGIQYQTPTFNIRLSGALSFIGFGGVAESIKVFLNGPQRHHFGVALNAAQGFSVRGDLNDNDVYDHVYFYELAFAYILDIGDFNGFQLHGGAGFLMEDNRAYQIIDFSPSVTAGINYVF